MSKYVLAKDLPFAKAGLVADDGSECIFFHFDRTKRDGFYRFREDEIQQLINEGWIEEVKPREWILSEYRGHISTLGFPMAENQDVKTIKVREVLWHTRNNQ